MKRYLYTLTAIVAMITAFGSCSDDEGAITPSGNYSPIRGEFPQGDSEYDDIIKTISEEYGVYLLYKDITEQDLNRDWVSTGTGDLYVAGYEEDRDKGAWDLPLEQLPFYVNFFNDYIFPNITPEFAQVTFPVKIYMINNLRTEPRDLDGEDSDEDGSEDGSTPNTGTDTGIADTFKSIKTGNFDNWAISFKEDVINGVNTEFNVKRQRCMFITKAINNAKEKDIITSPDEFWDGFNFNDTIVHNNPDSPYYKYKYGFVDDIYDEPKSNDIWWLRNYLKHGYYWEKGKYPDYDLFMAYVKNAMWLTPDELEERYPSNKYPMIKEKYEVVVKHMKESYGIDLVGLAKGKEE